MRRFLTLALAVTAFAAIVGTAAATHSWGSYHWARTANPFTLTVIDSMTPDWDDNLPIAIGDWNSSTVMNVTSEPGDDSSRIRKRCPAVTGKVRACNAAYGLNGWLGLAQIWVSGGGHITQATAKMNDSYFASASYTETKRQHVICQEIGHDFGLGHQSETGADLNTCMDYSNALDNPHPNDHDYAQLETIYKQHLDSTTTIAAGLAGSPSAKPVRVERTDRIADSIITEHFQDGTRRITHVFWALETRGRAAERAFGNDG